MSSAHEDRPHDPPPSCRKHFLGGLSAGKSRKLKGNMLGSFKLKLVGTFLALSVLPLAAAFWGFSQVAERSVTSSTDDRLEAGLSAALVAFEDERQRAGSAAERLGRDPAFQAAVAQRRPRRDREAAPASPALRVEMPGGPTIGRGPAARRRDRRLGWSGPGSRSVTIVAAVPLTEALARRLHARSGLTAPDELALVRSDAPHRRVVRARRFAGEANARPRPDRDGRRSATAAIAPSPRVSCRRAASCSRPSRRAPASPTRSAR